nr:hypothetical protein CFP56_79192 [Quercus suber]
MHPARAATEGVLNCGRTFTVHNVAPRRCLSSLSGDWQGTAFLPQLAAALFTCLAESRRNSTIRQDPLPSISLR